MSEIAIRNIRPTRGRLTVRRLPEPHGKHENGCYVIEDVKPGEVRLVTPEVAIERSRYGIVLEVGPGKLLKNGCASAVPEVQAGDRVWWGSYTDAESERPWSDDVALLQEADIVAVERGGRLVPLANRLLVEWDEVADQAGSIILPDIAKAKPLEGTVIAAGPGQLLPTGRRRPLDIKLGDRIAFGNACEGFGIFQQARLAGREYVVLLEKDVLAVLDERRSPS